MNQTNENHDTNADAKLLLAVVNDSESFEDYFKRQVEGGFISENGTPLKCECGGTEFKQVDKYFGEGYIEEYALECTNEDCLKIVGRWSCGSWMV